MTPTPPTTAELLEMARSWPLMESDAGDVFSGDVLIHKLGEALEAALRAQPPAPSGTCATCRHWQAIKDDPHHRYWKSLGGDDSWKLCRAPDFPSDGTWTPPTFGCTLHEPPPAEAGKE